MEPERAISYDDTDIPKNSDLMVEMLCSEHPKNLNSGRAEREAMEAIIRETQKFGGAQQAYEYLLDRTKLYKKLTAEWPESEQKYIHAADTFFRDKVYLADEKHWAKGVEYSEEKMVMAARFV